MGVMDNLDWKRVGVDAIAAAGGLVVGGPLGAGGSIAVAEALQHRSRSDAWEDTDAAQTPEE